MTPSDRQRTWAVFALLFVSYAYFYQAGGWNENSRFDLVRAIVEDHSLAIDRFHTNTGDKARIGDHYYSDKAPGLSFVAVPLYAVFRIFRSFWSSEHDFLVLASYILTVLTVSAAGAAAGALVLHTARKLGASPSGALFAALAYGLGSTAFPLSTMLFGHQLAALVLFLAFVVAWDARDRPSHGRSAAVAFLCATAVLVEFPTAPAAALIALYHVGVRPSRRTWMFLGVAAIPAVGLALYLGQAFGNPTRVGYDLLADPASRAEMRAHGFFGISWPRPTVIAELLIGKDRGLFPYSPVLLLAFPGFLRVLTAPVRPEGEDGVRRLRDVDTSAMRLAAGIVAYFLLFVSSYEWWQGGAAFGSRHLGPMLPFLALPIALVADVRPRLTTFLLVPSIVFMTIVTAVQPKPSERHRSPFWHYELPAFVRGDLSASNACPVTGSSLLPGHDGFLPKRTRDAFNLGMVLGGTGHRSLVPLLGLWVASAWALRRGLSARDEEGTPAAVDA